MRPLFSCESEYESHWRSRARGGGNDNGGCGEEVVGRGEDRINLSTGRFVHQGSRDDRADIGVEKSLAERAWFRDENVDILY